VKDFFPNRKPDPSKVSGPYKESLVSVTKAGTLFTAAFFLIFALVYWLGNYPLWAVGVNLISAFCSLSGYLLIRKYGLHRIAAHMVTFAIYLSSAGVMAISGGIHSSSVIWQVFVPVAAFIMAGLYAGLRWGGVSFVTVLTFYFLGNIEILQHITSFEPTSFDLLLDLTGTILAVSIAIWYSDHLKSHSLTQLDQARIRLNFFATVDPLTNTFNRRHFLELSSRKIKRLQASRGLASFLMFDIDQFKKINDEYGPLIGDQILHGVAQVCTNNLRSDDILGRFGGEEFVVLLPDTKLEDAKAIAERLRSSVSENAITTDIGQVYVSISIGIATMEEKATETTIDQLLLRADLAMYLAKQSGRNRVIAWDGNDDQTT